MDKVELYKEKSFIEAYKVSPRQFLEKELEIIKGLEEVSPECQEEIEKRMTDDILDRYNNNEYWNEDIITEVLEDFGYQLK